MDQELQPAQLDQLIPPVPPQPKKNNFLLWVLFLVLLLGSSWGLYLAARDQGWLPSQRMMAKTYEECASLPNSIIQESYPATCVTADGQRFVQPISTSTALPTETAAPTANWKTFITDDKKVSFKYPSGWTVDQNTTSEGWGKSITTANLKNDKFHLSVSVANAFMNECMQEISKQNITLSGTTFYKRYFTGVYSGEACSNKENLGNSEIWLQPTLIDKEPYNYQYGLLLNYNNLHKSEAETLFDHILSTFKFTN